MPEYLHPGVYIEEVERGPRPIEGVPTSTSALLGETERGPLKPRLVTSYKDYKRWFGGTFGRDKFLPYTANGFFENGGKRAFICRIVGKDAKSAEQEFGDFLVRAAGPGNWGNSVFVSVRDGRTKDKDNKPVGFSISVAYWSGPAPAFNPFEDFKSTPRPSYTEQFEDLVMDESSPDFYGKRVPFIDRAKGESNEGPESSALFVLIRKADAPEGARPGNDPGKLLAGGKDDANALTEPDFKGEPITGVRDTQGLDALRLDPYRDVALVYAPNVDPTIAKAIITHCEDMRFRFAVIDSVKGVSSTTEINPRNSITDSSFGALYYPWITISDPTTGARKLIPPGGHVLGVYARTDTERGVFKAPANEILRGALELEIDVNDQSQDDLNPKGVNVTRSFPGRGIRVWGARTLSSNPLWKYVSVRRLFIFLERSIYENTQWVVFEPNDDRLWARVKDTIRLFLRAQWRGGALFGRTEEEAFQITIDRTTMSQDDILNGRLICEIGIAPVRPAEFVIFRIFQNTAEAQS